MSLHFHLHVTTLTLSLTVLAALLSASSVGSRSKVPPCWRSDLSQLTTREVAPCCQHSKDQALLYAFLGAVFKDCRGCGWCR